MKALLFSIVAALSATTAGAIGAAAVARPAPSLVKAVPAHTAVPHPAISPMIIAPPARKRCKPDDARCKQ